jgi:apolipoprotein N-acyltransferase
MAASTEPSTGTSASRPAGPAERRSSTARLRTWGLSFVACVAAGLLLAASMPPWGFWPLGFAGIVVLDRALADRPWVVRFRRGWLVALALFAPTLWWIHDLTLPGYFVAIVVYAAMFGLCSMLVPPGVGRRVALPGAWVLAEQWKGGYPFGGVPISNLAIGQVGGPLAPVLRLFGWSFLTMLVVVGGVALSCLVDLLVSRRLRSRSFAGFALGVVVLAGSLGAASVAPRGHAVGRPLRVAVVQGGGPQGTRAINTDMNVVFQRHLDASKLVKTPVDLVLWPEDVVDVSSDDPTSPPVDISQSPKGAALSALAARLHSSLIAGVVQDAGPRSFSNFAIAYGPDGHELGRYEKVHRVPFGEYVPLRSFIEQFAGSDLTVRDAVIGRGPAVLHTPGTTWGVSISWEIFFAHRARSAIGAGGEVLLNPTNGSTYTGTLVQTQQVASSRMRAIEEGRWVLQAAPTGFSAIIDADGHVLSRTGISEQRVLQGTVQRRQGLTLYNRLGEWPMLATAVVLLLLGWWLDGLANRRSKMARA